MAEIDVRWHETLARATKNRLRIGIALGIHEAVLRRHRAAIPAHERSRSIPDEIDAITKAVAAGDPDGGEAADARAHPGLDAGVMRASVDLHRTRGCVTRQLDRTPAQRADAACSKRQRTTGGSTNGDGPGHVRSS